ncbi:unnamed protein product, partial [Polarella glacialis]
MAYAGQLPLQAAYFQQPPSSPTRAPAPAFAARPLPVASTGAQVRSLTPLNAHYRTASPVPTTSWERSPSPDLRSSHLAAWGGAVAPPPALAVAPGTFNVPRVLSSTITGRDTRSGVYSSYLHRAVTPSPEGLRAVAPGAIGAQRPPHAGARSVSPDSRTQIPLSAGGRSHFRGPLPAPLRLPVTSGRRPASPHLREPSLQRTAQLPAPFRLTGEQQQLPAPSVASFNASGAASTGDRRSAIQPAVSSRQA